MVINRVQRSAKGDIMGALRDTIKDTKFINYVGLICYSTVLMSVLICSITMALILMSGIINRLLEDNPSYVLPHIAYFGYSLVYPIAIFTIGSAVISAVIKIFTSNNIGDLNYKLKKSNGVLYNLVVFVIMNTGVAAMEMQSAPILVLALICLITYGLFGYIILDGLYKIVLKDIYMALKSEFIAHEVGL